MASNHLYMIPAVVDPSGLQRYSDRVVDGIAAVFLALKRRPVIRYQRTYDTAKRIAHETAVSVKLWNKFSSGVSLVVLRELRPQYGPGFDSRWPPGNSHADLLWRPRPKTICLGVEPAKDSVSSLDHHGGARTLGYQKKYFLSR